MANTLQHRRLHLQKCAQPFVRMHDMTITRSMYIDYSKPASRRDSAAIVSRLGCGTPVIGFPRGSVPEIIVEGETGFIVEDIDRALTSSRLGSSNENKLTRSWFLVLHAATTPRIAGSIWITSDSTFNPRFESYNGANQRDTTNNV